MRPLRDLITDDLQGCSDAHDSANGMCLAALLLNNGGTVRLTHYTGNMVRISFVLSFFCTNSNLQTLECRRVSSDIHENNSADV